MDAFAQGLLEIRKEIMEAFREIGIPLRPEDVLHRVDIKSDPASPVYTIAVGPRSSPYIAYRFAKEEIEATRDLARVRAKIRSFINHRPCERSGHSLGSGRLSSSA